MQQVDRRPIRLFNSGCFRSLRPIREAPMLPQRNIDVSRRQRPPDRYAGAAPKETNSSSCMGIVSRDRTANSTHSSPSPIGIMAKPAQS